jgi:hypothetical protein
MAPDQLFSAPVRARGFKLSPLERQKLYVERWPERNQRRITGITARHHREQLLLAGRPKPEHCELCGGLPDKKGIVWDHDHASGEFRGWLCGRCNLVLGKVKDDPELLRKLADYLDR